VESEDAGAPLGGWRRHRAAYQAVMRDRIGVGDDAFGDRPRPTLDEAVALALES
jgi:hypothetical protein